MQSDADVDPLLVVVPLPQLTHCAVEDSSEYLLTGQLIQLGVDDPSANPQPLPTPQALEQVESTHSTSKSYETHPLPE